MTTIIEDVWGEQIVVSTTGISQKAKFNGAVVTIDVSEIASGNVIRVNLTNNQRAELMQALQRSIDD